MKIGLFGGTFNPVHNEHVNIAKFAIKELKLDKLIVLPTNITPLKDGKITASSIDRYNMCRLAFENMPKVEVSAYELDKGGVSYTYLTCQEFKSRYPQDDLYFVLGGDMYENFKLWKNPEEILKCVTLAVCSREKSIKLRDIPAVKFSYIGAKVSSTHIRTLAVLGEDIGEYVPKKVEDYIIVNRVYLNEKFLQVKKYITNKRWKHTVGVAVTATENCARYNISEDKAIAASVYHDCAKSLSLESEELKGLTCDADVPPQVIHQYAGAYLAEHIFGVNDIDILNAVRYHCSGRENMTNIEQLIFISDMIEEGRDFDGVNKLRRIFKEDTKKGLYACLKRQVEFLNEKKGKIYYLTQKALNYLEEQKDDE